MEPENQEQEILMENEPFLFGGEVYTEGYGININDQNEISVDTNEIQEKLTAGDNITIENNVISATGGEDSDFTILTDEDVNFTDPDSGDEIIALWKLDSGTYKLDPNLSVSVVSYLVYEDENTVYAEGYVDAGGQPIILINNGGGTTNISIYTADSESSNYYGVATSQSVLDEGTLISRTNLASGFGGVVAGATENGFPGLVPGPYSYDVNKFLRSDGSWQSIVAPTIVQTTGTSQTDIMSQNAVTGLIYADTSDTTDKIRVGNSNQIGTFGVSVGGSAAQTSLVKRATNIGGGSQVLADGGTAIGNNAGIMSYAYVGSVALGSYSQPSLAGEVHIGTSQTQYGYNNTNYRLLSGVHDPVRSQDAATKNYVDNIVVNYAGLYNAGAPTTSTVAYYLGQFYYDTTNDDIYYCSNIDTTDPDNPVYTWSALPTGGGGGGDIVYSTKTTSNASNGGAVYIGDKDSSNQVIPDPTTTDNHRKYYWGLPKDPTKIPANNTVNIMGAIGSYGNDSVSILGGGANQYSVEIGSSSYAGGSNSVAIGRDSNSKNTGVAIGQDSLGSNFSIAIGGNAGKGSATGLTSCVNLGYQAGYNSQSGNTHTVNLGAFSRGTRKGEVNIGLVTGDSTQNANGYNNTAYRVIGGVHDGVDSHDVATVGQINATIDAINTALNTNIPHIGA